MEDRRGRRVPWLRRDDVLRALVALAAGGALAAAFPPSPQPWLVAPALTALLYVLADAAPRDWWLAGTLAGAVWFHVVPRAVGTHWGLTAAVVMYVALAVALGFVFAAAGFVSRRWGAQHRGFAMAAVWPIAVLGIERVVRAPILLAPAWVEAPRWLAITRSLGAVGFDLLIWTCAAGVVFALRGAPRRGAAVAAGAFLTLFAARGLEGPRVEGTLRVAGLQPNVATRDFERAPWSLYERRRIETRLDAMTEAAIAAGVDLVVWPEGGNELDNGALQRRAAALAALTSNTKTTVLDGSRAVDARGRITNTAATWADGARRTEVVKSNPVPFAESKLLAGTPRVVDVAGVSAGVSICFDAIFSDHVDALVEAGAAVLVATSDDASLADTHIAAWHAALARIRAFEVGRALVFVSNAGPTLATDLAGRRAQGALPLGVRGTMTADVQLTTARAPSRGGRWIAALVPLLLLVGLRRGEVAVRSGAPAAALPLVITALLVAGVAARRADAIPPPRDDLSVLFAQSEQRTCGAAALAFSMTLLGAEVFEGDVLTAKRPSDPRGYSMAELAELAKRFGFEATGWAASLDDLEDLGGAVALALLDVGHFVAVLSVSDDVAVLFDPSLGRTVQLPRAELAALYAGRALVVTP